MSVKFFGQFLIERGEIDGDDLRRALDALERSNVSLGDLAVEFGYLDDEAVYSVNRKQSHVDLPFGALAVEMSLLTKEQLDELMGVQSERNKTLGEHLVGLGIVDTERMKELWAEFEEDQAPYSGGETHLPFPLCDDPVSRCVMDLIPKLCRRVAKVNVRVARGMSIQTLPPFDYQASVRVHNHKSVTISIGGDTDFAGQLAGGAAGFELSQLTPELILDGVGEFLNVVAGSAMGRLELEGVSLELDPPSYDPIPAEGFGFELAATMGRGMVILRPE